MTTSGIRIIRKADIPANQPWPLLCGQCDKESDPVAAARPSGALPVSPLGQAQEDQVIPALIDADEVRQSP